MTIFISEEACALSGFFDREGEEQPINFGRSELSQG